MCLGFKLKEEMSYLLRGDSTQTLLLLPPLYLVLPVAVAAALAVQTRAIIYYYVGYGVIASITSICYFGTYKWSNLKVGF